MSFFDEGPDKPRTARRSPQQRPAAAGRAPATDQQTLMVRRGVAFGGGALVLILLILGVNGCLQSRKEAALRGYNEDVATIASASDEQVAGPFFETLQGRTSPLERQSALNQLRVQAEEHVDRARAFDVPDDMVPAQQSLIEALALRAGGVSRVAELLPAAVSGQGGEDAVTAIAGQMQAMLASDVLFDVRTRPFIAEALDEEELTGITIPDSSFMPDLAWLDPATVGERLGAGPAGGAPRGAPAPGTHGHGLESVSIGETTLQPGGAVNRVSLAGSPAFTVVLQNQGENDEQDVTVNLRVSGGAGEPLTVQRRVDMTTAGQPTEVAIPLDRPPPVGEPLTVEVQVAPVPGEEMADNNAQEYTVLFTE